MFGGFAAALACRKCRVYLEAGPRRSPMPVTGEAAEDAAAYEECEAAYAAEVSAFAETHELREAASAAEAAEDREAFRELLAELGLAPERYMHLA